MKQVSFLTPSRYPTEPGYQMMETSFDAAKAVKPKASTLRDSVLALLRQRAMSADEVAGVLGESVLTIRPRVAELKRLGLIEETGQRHKNKSGKLATVWKVK